MAPFKISLAGQLHFAPQAGDWGSLFCFGFLYWGPNNLGTKKLKKKSKQPPPSPQQDQQQTQRNRVHYVVFVTYLLFIFPSEKALQIL